MFAIRIICETITYNHFRHVSEQRLQGVTPQYNGDAGRFVNDPELNQTAQYPMHGQCGFSVK
jgi:hypothetical protein